MGLRNIWNRLVSTRYTRLLEREVARLRAENRALLNSILGVAGVPPLPAEPAPEELQTGRLAVGRNPEIEVRSGGNDLSGNGHAAPNQGVPGSGARGQGAMPLRRRSWQQINRMLELESARKKAEA